MKVSELNGVALDWAVAHALGLNPLVDKLRNRIVEELPNCTYRSPDLHEGYRRVNFTTDWAQGGPIIERERITVNDEGTMWSSYIRKNLFNDDGSECWQTGATPLIAAMRCYCASKLGDDVEIPEELL